MFKMRLKSELPASNLICSRRIYRAESIFNGAAEGSCKRLLNYKLIRHLLDTIEIFPYWGISPTTQH